MTVLGAALVHAVVFDRVKHGEGDDILVDGDTILVLRGQGLRVEDFAVLVPGVVDSWDPLCLTAPGKARIDVHKFITQGKGKVGFSCQKKWYSLNTGISESPMIINLILFVICGDSFSYKMNSTLDVSFYIGTQVKVDGPVWPRFSIPQYIDILRLENL